MIRIVTCIFLLLSVAICTRAVKGAEIQRASIDVASFYSKRDLFIPEYSVFQRPQLPYQQSKKEVWSYSLMLRNDYILLNTDLGRTMWHNTVTGASTTTQFRYVGYEFRLIQEVKNGVSIFYHHHSEHGIDIERGRYPLHDSFGVSFCFGGSDC